MDPRDNGYGRNILNDGNGQMTHPTQQLAGVASNASAIGLYRAATNNANDDAPINNVTLSSDADSPPNGRIPNQHNNHMQHHAEQTTATTTRDVHHHPDLPFLVTHWLSQYAPPAQSNDAKTSLSAQMPSTLGGEIVTAGKDQTNNRKEALKIIRQQACNLAWAFQTLGAYGQSSHVTTISRRPTTYSDLSRKYSSLLSVPSSRAHGNSAGTNTITSLDSNNPTVSLLDSLVGTSSSAHVVAAKSDLKSVMPWSLLGAAYEGSVPTEDVDRKGGGSDITLASPSGKKTNAGRTVGGSSSANAAATLDNLLPCGDISGSAMMGKNAHNVGAVRGDVTSTSLHAAQASRRQLSFRMEAAAQRKELECTLLQQSANRSTTFDNDSELDRHRVVAQIERRAMELLTSHSHTMAKVMEAKKETKKSYNDLASVRRQYQDPYPINGEQSLLRQILGIQSGGRNLGFGARSRTPGKNNMALSATLTRQYQGRYRAASFSQTRLSVLKSRLSHAVTISSHLVYPVYCLKFDKTGNYFITGADDQVVKLFHLCDGCREVGSADGVGADGSARGAVLVCSLRGHAGVVTDIDVSADNALLATASMDGDVRVWGLKDGCPVAILRGHKGGANMVSWSTLSPFRLVTCGEDGLARMWDIRKAAQKRYGEYYSWRGKKEADTAHQDHDMETEEGICNQRSLLPAQEGGREVAEGEESIRLNNPAIIGVEGNFGEFVANDRIDESVTLVAQLQHGTLLEESVTRTGKKKVKVMCIARCPIGGHFATGSDDGLGRVWADDDDWSVEKHDHELNEFAPEDGVAINTTSSMFLQSPNAPSTERLLAILREHNNPVTDMQYSNAGYRILTASMKDGQLVIWSWGKEGSMTSAGDFASKSTACFHPGPNSKFSNLSQLCIQLTPTSGGGPSTAKVHCDGAAWTCDDMKVITSQSSPTKASGSTDIIPGSHMMYVWDSHSGKCLMGILSSHSSLCSALAPHPTLSSVVATAGSDGVVNVWDLDRGDCFYHGPAEPKRCGYLEVQFSPDGLNLVLTDENGRVTVFNTHVPSMLRGAKSDTLSIPAWMTEQYFANDYYELVYDANGSCIERGSQQPPHLAPGGVRCTHEGVPNSDIVMSTYRELAGPLPLSLNTVRWNRENIRARGTQIRLEGGVISANASKKPKVIARSPDLPRRHDSTAIITKSGKLVHHVRRDLSFTGPSNRSSGAIGHRTSNPGRQLSNRYEWADAYHQPESDSDEDQGDGDYEGNGRRLEESSEEEEDYDEDGDGFMPRPRRRQQSVGGGGRSGRGSRRGGVTFDEGEQPRPSRASSRQISQRSYHHDSDDEELEQVYSTHTDPSGNFSVDWTASEHMFKMPRNEGDRARRNWLTRTGYQGDCLGRKLYCPQVGDSVVYIPRAHADTLEKYPIPGYSLPWESWPKHSSWPAVCCKVTHVRYRFPWKMYYRSRKRDEKLQGVAAVLTLEITGVPSQSSDRTLPWPAPTFVSPTASRTRSSDAVTSFEVTLFECGEEDFIIPEHFYSWRIKELERAIAGNGGTANGLSVTVYNDHDHRTEDGDLLGYTGKLVKINEVSTSEFHFMDSGYNALSMEYDGSGEDTHELFVFSVWSVSMNTPSQGCLIPTMGEETKNALKAAVHTIINPEVKELFHEHVDTGRYIDYLEMVEVPIYISLIQKRLRSNYYSNKLSVLADIELVRENCYKYNEDGDGYYDLACRMYDKFESLVDSIEEETIYIEDKTHSSTTASTVANNQQPVEGDVEENPATAKATACDKTGSDEESDSEISDGGESHNESEANAQSSRQARSERRAVESENQEVGHRRTRRSTQKSTGPDSPDRRTSSRATSKPAYEEKDSDEEEYAQRSGEDDKDESNGSGGDESSEEEAGNQKRDDEVSSEEEVVQTKRTRTSTKATRSKSTHTENDDEVSSEEKTQTKLRTRTSARARSKSTHAESDDGVSSEEETQTKLRTRTSARARSKSTRAESDDGVSSEEETQTKLRMRTSARARSKPSYEEKDSEEDEYSESSGDENEESEEEEVNTRQKRKCATESTQRKKRGRALTQNSHNYPDLEPWSRVSKRNISKVGMAILNKLRELDISNLFSVPALETFPEMEDEYLKAVKNPMDFRTIEEERLPTYQNIAELQEDLVLTFRNCCEFNGEMSEYYNYSIEIWQGLDDIFNECR
eukprot:CAMPEP_0172301324 /NCGR_PEP_ID=MMETSP1058-20130122/3238_1 /TAXON_ID=83371 /ORGANISM="Detonula confervacea, Strain CCMP 353" /LENGTH=2176 /DNA_ID=CAMNT_0013011391 /DNA_START=239 /DNA_END=6769 /DNA_ORIENTATION=-